MNDESVPIAFRRRIDLVNEADFRLGGVEIRPAECAVLAKGRRIRLEPRVMRVLVALAWAGGRPVSREALVDVCWGEVTLGDDALNRCIQKLRRLVEGEAVGAFEIETLPRVGYRLSPGRTAAPPPEVAGGAHRRGPWLFVAGGAAAIALIGVASRVWGPAPARWSVERSERLVSTPLAERHPAISPDGTMLAYSAGSDMVARHIYLKRIAGGDSIRLTDDGFDDAAPNWSPDGARIVYTTYRAGEPCRIMVTAVPGPARQMARCQGQERSRAVWSARGDALFVADNATPTAPTRIVRLDLATGRREAISHPPGGLEDREPAVSSDGRWVAFDRQSETSNLAILRDLKSGRERAVADLGDTGGLAWAGDSRTLFVAAANGGESTLWAWPMPAGPLARVSTAPVTVHRLAFGRGDLLAAEVFTGRFNAVRAPGPGESGAVVLDAATGGSWSPAYAPDGTLAVVSDRSGGAGVWLSRLDAPARLLVDLAGGSAHDLSWSPDGASLAFSTARDGKASVRVVGAAGETRASIPVPGVTAGRAAWNSDARSLVFPVRDGGGWRLWRADLARPARPWPITGYGWAAVRMAGDNLYAVRSDRPGVWRLGPPPRLIVAGFSGRSRESWTIYKNEIVFVDDREDGGRPLSAPLTGGAARPFADPPGWISHDFAIDPTSGKPTYIAPLNFDTDIELFHLTRK